MTGRQKIEIAVTANGYTDGDEAYWKSQLLRRYTKGRRRITVYYDTAGRVISATFAGGRSVGGTNRAEQVIGYLEGVSNPAASSTEEQA